MQRDRVAQRSAVVLAAVGIVAVAVTGCSAAGGASGPGLELVKSKCTTCHSYERVSSADHDRKGWEETVARMRRGGAVLTDAEAASIVEYLSSQ